MVSELDEYEVFLRSCGFTERTVGARVKFARGRFAEWGGWGGFTPTNIRVLLGRPDLKRWSRCTYFSHLASLCEWAVAAEYLADNPMEGMKRPKSPDGLPRPLSEKDVERVMALATEPPVRDWLTIALLTGLRVSEIARIRGEDVQQEGIFVRGKGEVEAVLPCHPDIWAMAQEYPRQGYWFPGSDHGHIRPQKISNLVGVLFHSLGISGSIHRARHTYGTRLIRAGVNVRKVQRLMRHKNLETTANYTAVDEDELRDAILLLPSVGQPPAA